MCILFFQLFYAMAASSSLSSCLPTAKADPSTAATSSSGSAATAVSSSSSSSTTSASESTAASSSPSSVSGSAKKRGRDVDEGTLERLKTDPPAAADK